MCISEDIMTIKQRQNSFAAVRDRQPSLENLRDLINRHGKSIQKDQVEARKFFVRVGVLTAKGRVAKPYCATE